MPEATPAKPFREKIVDAIATEGGILNPRDSLQTVSEQMRALDSNLLPVTEDGLLVGLADEPDPGRDASSHGHDPKSFRIAESMNRDIVFCREQDDCADALRKMEDRKLSHLPVVDHEMRIVGLVAWEDLHGRLRQAEADHTVVGPVGPQEGLDPTGPATPDESK